MELTDAQIRAALSNPDSFPPCARHLGFELIDFSVAEGWAQIAFMPRPEFANPAGNVQGGFICAMLDDAMSVSASISKRLAIIVPTLQINVSYLRPTPIARVVAHGEVLRSSASSVAMQGVLRNVEGDILAIATATAVPRPFPRVGAEAR